MSTAAAELTSWYTPFVSDGPRSYTDDEVEAIFRRALERQASLADGFEHDELVAAAREVGLDEASIARAVHEMESEREEEDIRLAVQKNQRDRWLRHLVTYLVIAGGFLGMHALGLVGVWAIWMAFGWGAGLALQTFSVFRGPTEEAITKERTKRNRKARRIAKARARAEAKRRQALEKAARRQRKSNQKGVEDELERVIEEGVTLLLGAAAKKLREATAQLDPPAKPPETEFGRYVADKKAGRPAPSATGQTPRRDRVKVRVSTDELEEEADELAKAARRRRSQR